MHPFLLDSVILIVGGALGYVIRAVIFIVRKNSLELSVSEKLVAARADAQKILDDAKEKSELLLKEAHDTEKQKDRDIKAHEDRLIKKESTLDERQSEVERRMKQLEQKSLAVETQYKQAEELLESRTKLLETTAGFSVREAREVLLEEVEHTYTEDLAVRQMKLDTVMRDTLTERARDILMTTIQRLAVPMTAEQSVSYVQLPSDDLKGKIIGKEGRNIRVFERVAGVELLVDESPDSIVVSCFDPVRRAIATVALTELVKDGRIQPARIEEVLETAKITIHDVIKERGTNAVYECGIYSLDPRVVAILGRLHYRTSYGQNVLQHSIEMTHIASMLAHELGADIAIAKAGALVHDIGKALDHEFEGTHVDIGIKMLRRFGTDERIITAMKSHHDDVPHESLEAIIVQTADMISGSRPGARRDTSEMYIKRLNDLESLAARFIGVEKVYALQAGRELRIFVHPEAIDDIQARDLARSIALGIETELRYPGQIKVTIIRETRVIDFAR